VPRVGTLGITYCDFAPAADDAQSKLLMRSGGNPTT
jgi:hypothetical protein